MNFHTKTQQALEGAQANTRVVAGYPHPVLIEGGNYPGIWLECGPLEGLIYARHASDPEEGRAIARANHDIFFHFQREDGQFPCWVWFSHGAGFGQIQMVVPIAATAWETAQLLGEEAFLLRTYEACARWDDWLARTRDGRGLNLCEAFCEFDTGHDNSPRFFGLPHECPNRDARVCPDAGNLPFLAPDLSASLFGGRVALSEMARALGKEGEANGWQEKAEKTRVAMMEHLFDPEDECFYDRDKNGDFVRLRGDVLTRVLGEHVVEQPLFERIYSRHIVNPNEFWTPFPLPSIAANDPQFVRALPPNSWGGASQALTALRAPRWFDFYGKGDDLRHLMERWVESLLRADGFMQQMNPWTGEFSTSQGYSPAMLVWLEFSARSPAVETAGNTKRSRPTPTERSTSAGRFGLALPAVSTAGLRC